MNQSAIWKEEKKNRLKASFHFVQYELSQESNLAHTVKQREKKIIPHWMWNVTCILSVSEILKRIPKDLWSWGHNILMTGFVCTYPPASRWRPKNLKLTSDVMNTWNDEEAGQGQAASLKQSRCVSGLPISRQQPGQGNGLSGHKTFTSVLLLSLLFEVVCLAFSNIPGSQPDSYAC